MIFKTGIDKPADEIKPKVPTAISPHVLYGGYVNQIKSDIRLKLLSPESPILNFDAWSAAQCQLPTNVAA